MMVERGMVSARTLNPQLLRDWAHASAENLTELRGEINDLNVFPIPDSDTGSNMVFTMAAAADAAAALPADAEVAQVARAMADGAVGAARGNSGIILSQVLVGFADAAEVLGSGPELTFRSLVTSGLRLASRAATRAVSEPREGTVLTLIRVAADTAAADTSDSASDLARAIADDCAEALEHTPDQLPVLAAAGVVDAGGRGFLAMLDAMVNALTGVSNRRRRYRGILTGGGEPGHPTGDTCADGSDMDFEVMYLLDGAAGESIAALRTRLDQLGDAVVIVGDSSAGDGERFSVHVHTCEPGGAVQAGVDLGHISDIRISCFALDALRAQVDSIEPPPRHKRAVVAAVRGEGAADLFREAGASVLRADDGLTAEQLAAAIRDTDSAHVVVMANGALPSQELVTVATEVRSNQRSIVTLPTSSMAQCLAALAVHDPSEEADIDAYAMAEAAAGTRLGSLQVAEQKMMTLAGTCEVGDILGLIGDDVLVVAPDQTGAATALIDLMLATGGELVTVLAGSAVDREAITAITELMRRGYPGIELTVYETGQHTDLIQVGVE
ncbi:DAK2 domain-containing protein [Gordonia sp. ABSL1-1]|uniref:DAK2 domain-containing protein n=1 Tax=Gordonia sp. ABSL1-1 TaxID=3053923 RepID=UPI002573C9CE|nr:DAK2 domain-containing protein [Gordonia sp. ABSL1-1]MDL9935560.1 DAK2 domain-containing protein [Gordonia sp. ABSL1-1]